MNELMKMLLDEYANKILFVTQKRPKPAFWISEKCGIPIAVCYRRINKLEELGLLQVYESRLNQKGKRVKYYISLLDHAVIYRNKRRVNISIELTDGKSIKEEMNLEEMLDEVHD